MVVDFERRRVVVVAGGAEWARIQICFAHEALEDWEAREADSFERARFILQHEGSDVLLVDESLYRPDDREGLAWLATQRNVPVVFLVRPSPELMIDAYERGINNCLQREMVFQHPPLLAAALSQAYRWTELRQRYLLAGQALHECKRKTSQLLAQIWDTVPGDPRTRWMTQRHMMERLQEEVTRSERHNVPLAIALGEVVARPQDDTGAVDLPPISGWIAERIGRVKRRCDVAGHYGPQGFMLLLTQTGPEGALVCCRRLQNMLEQAVTPPPGTRAPIRAYFGVSTYSPAVRTPKGLLSSAEQRLERSKASGKGGVEIELP